MTSFDRHQLVSLKRDFVAQLVSSSAGQVTPPVFSVAAFGLLAVLFPPGALMYAMRAGS